MPDYYPIRIQRMPSGEGLPHPAKANPGDGGFDLSAAIPSGVTWHLEPGDRMLFPTGFAWAIPRGYVGQIWPRSKLANKQGINRLAGVVDHPYRGEVFALLINHHNWVWHVKRGDRIAQMVIAAIHPDDEVQEVAQLDSTVRGDHGITTVEPEDKNKPSVTTFLKYIGLLCSNPMRV